MPRKVTASLQRKVMPDRKYQSVLVQRLINKSMLDGKKQAAERANYQIPFPIAGHRQLHFAMSWLVQSARARSGMSYAKRLEAEIVDAYNEAGAAFKKKEDCHRMAEANRAFAHFARA